MTQRSGVYDNDMEQPTDYEIFSAINTKRSKDRSEITMRKEHPRTEDT